MKRSKDGQGFRIALLLVLGAAALGVTFWALPYARRSLEPRMAPHPAGRERRMQPLPAPPPVALASPSPAPPRFLQDPAQLPVQREIANGLDVVEDLAFSADGKRLFSAGYGDFSVRVWDASTGSEVQGLRTQRRPMWILLRSDGSVLVGDVYSFLGAYPIHSTGRLGWARLTALEGLLGRDAAISADGRLVASSVVASYGAGEESSTLVLLNAADLSLLRKLTIRGEALRRPAFSPTGRLLVAGSTANTFTLWDLASGEAWVQVVQRVGPRSDIGSVAFSPDERLLATGHMDSSITIWDVVERRQRHNFYVPQASTWEVAFSPAGDVLATAQQDGTIRLWDPATAQPRGVLRGHGKNVREIAFSPDGRRLASYGEDGRILLWETPEPIGASPAAGTPSEAPSPPESMAMPEILKLFAKVQAMEGLSAEQRALLRRELDRFPAMSEDERARFAASLILLASADTMAAQMRQAFLASGAGDPSHSQAEWTRFNLDQVPEAAPLVTGIEAARREDVAMLRTVFARSAAERLEKRGWAEALAKMRELWLDLLGGLGPSELHVAYLGTRERGQLQVSHPTRELSRAPIPGSVDLLEVPVVLEDGAWKIAAAPRVSED